MTSILLEIFESSKSSGTVKYKLKFKQKLENPIEDHVLGSIFMKHVISHIGCSKNMIPTFEGSFGIYMAMWTLSNPLQCSVLISTWSTKGAKAKIDHLKLLRLCEWARYLDK